MFKFRKTNTERFIEAYDKFADAIFRHLFFRISDRELAKDLLQETFTKTWDFIVGGGEIQNLRAFLYKVANNLIVDQYRKKKTLSLDELKEKGIEIRQDIKEELDVHFEAERLISIISKLPEIYKDAIIMRYVDGFSVKEIAGILNDSENAIYVRLHRGLKQLREFLKRQDVGNIAI